MKKISHIMNVRRLLLAILVPMAVNVLGMRPGGEPVKVNKPVTHTVEGTATVYGKAQGHSNLSPEQIAKYHEIEGYKKFDDFDINNEEHTNFINTKHQANNTAGVNISKLSQTSAAQKVQNATKIAVAKKQLQQLKKNAAQKTNGSANELVENGVDLGQIGENATQTRSSNPPPTHTSKASSQRTIDLASRPLPKTPNEPSPFASSSKASSVTLAPEPVVEQPIETAQAETLAPEAPANEAASLASKPFAQAVNKLMIANKSKSQAPTKIQPQEVSQANRTWTQKISNKTSNALSMLSLSGNRKTTVTNGKETVVQTKNSAKQVVAEKITNGKEVINIKYKAGTNEPTSMIIDRINQSSGKSENINITSFKDGKPEYGTYRDANGRAGVIKYGPDGKSYEIQNNGEVFESRIVEPNGTSRTKTTVKDIATEVIANDPTNPDIITTKKSNTTTNEPLETVIENSTTGLKSTQKGPDAPISLTTENGNSVNFTSDGGYSIEGNNAIVFVDAAGNVTTSPLSSYAAKRIAGRVGRGLARAGKSAYNYATGKTAEPSGIKLEANGTVTNGKGLKVSMDPITKSLTIEQTVADGSVIKQALNEKGSIVKTRTKDNQTFESYDNGPELTRTSDTSSSFTNKDGSVSSISIDPATGKLMVSRSERQGLGKSVGLGRTIKGGNRVLDLSNLSQALKKADSKLINKATEQSISSALDQAAAKIIGEGNWFSDQVATKDILQSKEWKEFRDGLVEQWVTENAKASDAPFNSRAWNYGKRLTSFLISNRVTTDRTAVRNVKANRTADMKTSARSDFNNFAQKNNIEINNDIATIEQASGVTTETNVQSAGVINKAENGSVVYDPATRQFMLTSATSKQQTTISATGKSSLSRFKSEPQINSALTTQQSLSVDPVTGSKIIITTEAPNSVTGNKGGKPLYLTVEGVDGSVKIYNADSKGNLPKLENLSETLPSQEMRVTSNGDIAVTSNIPEKGYLWGKTGNVKQSTTTLRQNGTIDAPIKPTIISNRATATPKATTAEPTPTLSRTNSTSSTASTASTATAASSGQSAPNWLNASTSSYL